MSEVLLWGVDLDVGDGLELGLPVALDRAVVPPAPGPRRWSGDTTPYRMTGVTLHSHVRLQEI